MLDRTMLYDLIYALAARDGREAALFGQSAPFAREALARSLPHRGFPELWFELPLAGEPWFDLHSLITRGHLDAGGPFDPEACGGCPEAFAWFAAQERGVRQLALSWDSSAGDVAHPAIQLLAGTESEAVNCGFLDAAGRSDAKEAHRAFVGRMPEGWFACYTGVFPRRTVPFLRLECIPSRQLQQAYAADAALLERHLRQVGLTNLGDDLLLRCQALARYPFALEFQFDVTPDGRAGETFGASLRFAAPPDASESWKAFDPGAEAGELMRQVAGWGLVDDRWQLLAGTAFAKRAKLAGEAALLYCYPAFLKLRWRGGQPVDAKAYLRAGVQLVPGVRQGRGTEQTC